jgi:hypothetical protein
MAMKDAASVFAELKKADPSAFARGELLESLRKALRSLRGEKSQAQVAKRMRRDQSEVSRVENGVTNFTRLGTILDYIIAVEGNFLFIISDANNHVVASIASHPVSAQRQKEGSPTVTSKHLATEIAGRHDLSKRTAEAVLGFLGGIVTKHLKKGERVRIGDLGISGARFGDTIVIGSTPNVDKEDIQGTKKKIAAV